MRAFALAVLLALVSGATLVPAHADAGGPRSGFYIGGPVGTFAPPPPAPGQAQPRFYFGGPVGTFAPPAPVQPTYPVPPYHYYSYYAYRARCVTPGYWSYAFVPQAYTDNVWAPGQYSPDGIWIDGHYESRSVSGGYYQPIWVEPSFLC